MLFFLIDATGKLMRMNRKSAVSHDFSKSEIPLILSFYLVAVKIFSPYTLW